MPELTMLEMKANEVKTTLTGVDAGRGTKSTAIVEIIKEIVLLFKNCNVTPRRALRRANRRRLLFADQWKLSQVVADHCDDDFEATEAAIRDCCGRMSVAEMGKLYSEVD